MSLYKYLDTPLPTIAYRILHQAETRMTDDEYIRTVRDLHLQVAKESTEISAGYAKYLADAVGREAQTLQNGLAHFLSTPLQSDSEEVRLMFVESLGRFKDQILDKELAGAEKSWESKVSFVGSKKSVERRLLKNGKSYLGELGFVAAGNRSDVFESSFLVRGGSNLDVIEHIVRDRIGIYSTSHGKHIGESAQYVFSAHNLAFVNGDLPASDEIERYKDITFYFPKPEMKYAPFRNGLSEVLEKMSAVLKLKHISLWQRKLGLGAGKEFELRILSDDVKIVGKVVDWLGKHDDRKLAKESIVGHGHLVVKQLLFGT